MAKKDDAEGNKNEDEGNKNAVDVLEEELLIC